MKRALCRLPAVALATFCLLASGGLAAVSLPAPVAVASGLAPAWQVVPSANLDDYSTSILGSVHGVNDSLASISCTASGTCMAVGSGVTAIQGFTTSVSLGETSGAGGAWSLTPTPNPKGSNGDALSSVSCPADTECVAVGAQGQGLFAQEYGSTLGELWTGSKWVNMSLPAPTGRLSRLDGVSCPAVNTCFAVGSSMAPSSTAPSELGLITQLTPPPTSGGAFVNPAAGTAVSGQAPSSPDGTYTAKWNTDGTVEVLKGGSPVLTTEGTIGGFSPDGHAFVTETLTGGAIAGVQLFNLSAPTPGTAIFSASPTVTSIRLVFSPSGNYLLLAYTTASQTFFTIADTTVTSVAFQQPFSSGAINGAAPPGSAGASFGTAMYGFGPDDSKFLYAYLDPGAQGVEWRWTDMAAGPPQQISSASTSSTSAYAQFSPNGGVLAIVTGSSGGSVGVQLFDTTGGQTVGSGGPWSTPAPPALRATANQLVATVNGHDYPLGPNTDGSGLSWSLMTPATPGLPTPPTGWTFSRVAQWGLSGVSCVSASDCVAVGALSVIGYNSSNQYGTWQGPLIERWDGSSWSVAHAPFGTGGDYLQAVACAAASSSPTGDACTVVGHVSVSGAFATMASLQWNGTAWQTAHGPTSKGGSFILNSVDCLSSSDCTAAGIVFHNGYHDPALLHYNGTAWTQQAAPAYSVNGSFFGPAGVSCWASGECTAVGYTLGANLDYKVTGGVATDNAATLIMTEGQGWAAAATATPTSAAFGQSVTYSLSISGPGAPMSGVVAFYAGSTPLCTATLTSGGATCGSAAAPGGSQTAVAWLVFRSGSGADASLAGEWTTPLTVAPAPTATSVTAPAAATVGDAVRFAAAVTSPAGVPSGTVAFKAGSTALCTAILSAGGANCTSSAAPVGTDKVTGAFTPYSASFSKSSGSATLVVSAAAGAAATSTSIAVSPTTVTAGGLVRLSGTVSGNGGTPTGAVDFRAGTTELCAATLAGGSGSCLATAPPGTNSINGTYSGDRSFAPSAGTTTLTAAAVPPAIVLVANAGANTLAAFAVSDSGNAGPAATVAGDVYGSLDDPGQTAVDTSGNLWVASCASDEVVAYTPAQLAATGAPTPALRLSAQVATGGSQSLDCPQGLAFDAAGDLWVANYLANTLVAYNPSQLAAAGAPAPAVTISGPGLVGPVSLAFDQAGNLWVANYDEDAVVALTPAQLAATGAPTPAAPGIFAQGPEGLAFDAAGDLWVANSGGGAINGYTPAQLTSTQLVSSPATAISSDAYGDLAVPGGLAFDAAGDLWVSSAGTNAVDEYTPDQLLSSGSPTPADIIAGPSTGLMGPAGVAVLAVPASVPAVTAIAPAGGPAVGGTSVTITGAHFTPAATVAFGTAAATVVYHSPTSLTATAPPGSGTVDVTVGEAGGASATGSADQFTYVPAPAIPSASLPPATVGGSYTQPLSVAGGIAPYTWSVSGGSLPAGLSLDTVAGQVYGTPTATGSYTFTVQVTDGETPPQSATQLVSLTVNPPPLAVTTYSLPHAEAGIAYSQTLAATGGTTPYSWSVTQGSLPAGLSLNASTGAISGRATAAGTFTFTAQVADSETTPRQSAQTYRLTVDAALALDAAPLTPGTAGRPYAAALGSGGIAPRAWFVTGGSLPPGLSLNAATGTISGTPTAAGTSTFTVQGTDGAGATAAGSLALAIAAAGSTWQSQEPQPPLTTSPLAAIACGDAQHCLAATQDGTVVAAGGGGQPWARVGSVSAGGTIVYVYALACVDAHHCWASGGDENGDGVVWATADGGVMWAAQFTAAGESLPWLAFPNARDGWAVSNMGDVFATTDGGQSWTNIASGVPVSDSGGAIAFVNASDGWLVGGNTILATTDGGRTWTPQTDPSGAALNGVYFLNASDGWAVGNGGTVLSTTDGGATWGLQLAGVGPFNLRLSGIACADALHCWVSANGGANGAVWATGDGGASWSEQAAPAAGLMALAFPDAAHGWAVGTGGTILSYTPVAGPLAVSGAALPSGAVGQPFTATLAATGGTGPYTWSLAAGSSLPAGLDLDTVAGTVYGTPSAAGTSSFTVQVTDSSNPPQTATASLSLTVAATVQGLSVTTSSLPAGTVDTGYAETLTATGGTAPYAWSVLSGSLPAGLALNTVSGAVYGTPTAAGRSRFTVRVTDSASPAQTATASLDLAVAPAATSTTLTSSANPSVAGQSATFTAAVSLAAPGGGSPTGTVTFYDGTTSLGTGTLNESGQATLATSALSAGTHSLSAVYAGDADFLTSTSAVLSQVVSPGLSALSVTTASLPEATAAVSYAATLTATGGTGGGYTWSITGGSSLPAWLSLSAGGVLSGTPPAAGSSSFTVQVMDGAGHAATQALSLTVAAAPQSLTIVTSSLPAGVVGADYTGLLAAAGGTAPYTWSISGGALPPGVSLGRSSGTLTGTPAAPGTSSFTVQVRDRAVPPATATVSLTLQVEPLPLSVATASLPPAMVGRPYAATLLATGGDAPYAWSISSGGLPAGLSLDKATGALTGTPTSAGASTWTVQVADASSPTRTATAGLSLSVSPPGLAVSTTSLPGATAGSPYTAALAASGGTAPYTWSLLSGSLPAGLALNTVTGAVYGTVSGTAASGPSIFTVGVADAQAATAQQALALLVSPAPVAGTSAGAGSAGGAGTETPDTVVEGSGTGSVSVAQYQAGTNPVPGAQQTTFQAVGTYFDAAVAPGSSFNSVTIQKCGLSAGELVYWYDAASGQWTLAAPQSPNLQTGCDTVGPLTGSTSPTLAQLGGTPFTIAQAAATLQVGTDRASYVAGQTVAIAGTLANASVPSVSVDVSDPTGATVFSGAAAPDAQGAFSTQLTLGSGAPTGVYTVTAAAATTTGQVSASATFQVTPVLAVGTASLPGGTLGAAYAQTLSASGGTLPYTWSVSAGSLPAGLSLNPATGAIGGIPTAAGPGLLTVQVGDSAGHTASRPLSIYVLPSGTTVAVTGASAGAAGSGGTPASAGGGGSATPETTVAASGGTGLVATAQYSGDPEPGAPATFQNATFFDVAVAPGSTFTGLTLTRCGLDSTDALYWWNGTAWLSVSPQGFSGGCITADLSPTRSSPTIAELQGTPFAAGASASAPSGGGSDVVVPVVSGLQPASGPAAGGTTVTVAGLHLTGATQVRFGSAPAASFAVDSDSEITAVSPAGSGAVDVTVTTPYGTSATGSADQFTYSVGVSQTVPTTPAFADVPSAYWAYTPIETLAGAGIVVGFPDGSFRPDEPVTRAEFVKMLDLVLKLPLSTQTTAFADSPPSAWFAPYVAAAVQAGIVQGTSPETFSPDVPLTREQMAVLLARALKLTGTADLTFSDADRTAPWATAGVEAAVAAGYIEGFPDGTFQPLGTATRAQAAKVLALALSGQPIGALGG